MPLILIVFVVMAAFALMALKLFNSLRTMRIQMGVGVVVWRDESPVLFWLVIVLQCLAIGALLGVMYVTYLYHP